MTDQPATTPAADECRHCGRLMEGNWGYTGAAAYHYECAKEVYGDQFEGQSPPAADRVTALTLRTGDLREQRDQARRERDEAYEAFTVARRAFNDTLRQRDEARAQVVACQTRLDRIKYLFVDRPDTPCRTTWPDGIECVEIPMDELRAAFGESP